MRDTSFLPQSPGWLLRNVLYYLGARHQITAVTVLCLRQGDASRIGRVSVPLATNHFASQPQIVGWERDGTGKLASRLANLGPMLDPARCATNLV